MINKSSINLIAALTIVIFVLLTITAFLAYQNYLLNQKINGSSQVSISQSPTVTSDPTSDWKTYQDTSYTYSFKYPSDWVTEKVCLGGIAGDNYPCFKSPDLILNAVPSVDKGQLIIVGTKNSSVFPIDTNPNLFCQTNNPLEKIESCANIKLGKVDAIRRVSSISQTQVAIIQNSEIKLLFQLMYNPNQYTTKNLPSTFDEVLSTFQFTN